MQVYRDEVTDLMQLPTQRQENRVKGRGNPYFSQNNQQLSNCGQPLITVSGQICQPIRSMQDMAQLIRVAQQNRDVASRSKFKMSTVELRKRSHLIVRLIPENISAGFSPVFDFVELCGSDFAASANVASGSHQSEKDRLFAT